MTATLLQFPSTLQFGQKVHVLAGDYVLEGVLMSTSGFNGDRTVTVEVPQPDGGAMVWIGPFHHLRAAP